MEQRQHHLSWTSSGNFSCGSADSTIQIHRLAPPLCHAFALGTEQLATLRPSPTFQVGNLKAKGNVMYLS